MNKPVLRRLIAVTVLIAVTIMAFVIYLNRPATVVISAENGAMISVSTERGGEFKDLGETSAKFKTRAVPGDVFIRVTKDGKKTITTVPTTERKTYAISPKLSSLKKANPIFDGSTFNTFISGNTVQGIIPGEFTLTSFKTDSESTPRVDFINLPYMRKVIWYGLNDFVYANFKGGVGVFKGNDLSGSTIGSTITGTELSNLDEGENGEGVSIIDIAKTPSKPLVLLSRTNLFTSNDMGSTLTSIAGFESEEGISRLFATDSYIFRSVSQDPSVYVAESNTKDSEDEYDTPEHSIKLYQYSYSGEELGSFTINSESITSIVELNNISYILTDTSILRIDDNAISSTNTYFEFARDLISYNNEILLLGDDGLWSVSSDGIISSLVYDFKDNGVGLKNSFSLTDNLLIFGTQPRPGSSVNKAKMFSTEL